MMERDDDRLVVVDDISHQIMEVDRALTEWVEQNPTASMSTVCRGIGLFLQSYAEDHSQIAVMIAEVAAIAHTVHKADEEDES